MPPSGFMRRRVRPRRVPVATRTRRVLPSFSLTGRTALVTGASRGLGRAIALGLAAAGADLVLAARDQTTLRGAPAEAEALGRDVRIAPFELADAASVSRACGELLS